MPVYKKRAPERSCAGYTLFLCFRRLHAVLHGRADERHVAVILGSDCNIRVKQLFFWHFLVQKVLVQQKRRAVSLLESLLIEHEAQAVRSEQLHVRLVEVERHDLDAALEAGLLDGLAHALLAVGRT